MALFDAPEEETRSAASFALGSVSAGNLAFFVPQLLQTMEAAGSSHEYLMLHALKELLGAGGPSLGDYAPSLLPKLLAFNQARLAQQSLQCELLAAQAERARAAGGRQMGRDGPGSGQEGDARVCSGTVGLAVAHAVPVF